MESHENLYPDSTLQSSSLLSFGIQSFEFEDIFESWLMIMKKSTGNPLRLTSLNHISLSCSSLEKSLNFYQNVLGFFPIRRPGSFDFDGAWLFNYGIGIHLLQSEDPENMPKIDQINPKNNHISFQCESMATVEEKLQEMKIKYMQSKVEEGGVRVDQLFFLDPDGTMIEICNCDDLPVIPLAGEILSCQLLNLNVQQQKQQQLQQQQQQQVA